VDAISMYVSFLYSYVDINFKILMGTAKWHLKDFDFQIHKLPEIDLIVKSNSFYLCIKIPKAISIVFQKRKNNI
jgi:hypothetical protein